MASCSSQLGGLGAGLVGGGSYLAQASMASSGTTAVWDTGLYADNSSAYLQLAYPQEQQLYYQGMPLEQWVDNRIQPVKEKAKEVKKKFASFYDELRHEVDSWLALEAA